MVKIGETVEDFTLEGLQRGKASRFSLAKQKGKWVIILFYPADFSYVCPTELEEAAAHFQKLKKLGAVLMSISTDSIYTHKAWHDTSPALGKVEYPMLADPAGKVCRQFGTYLPETGESLRATFIIDPDRVLQALEMHNNSIGRNINEIIRKLQACQYVAGHTGQVCPVSWEPGDETLTRSLNLVGKI